MRVEFIGLPGVGKSTLRRDLLNHLQRIDKKRYLSIEEAFLQVSRLYIDSVFRRPLYYLPDFMALRLSNKLINRSLMQFEAQNRFLADKGKALEAYFASKVYCNMSPRDRKNVISRFLEMGSLWQSLKGRLPEEVVVIFEEGFIQKSFMFVDHSNGLLIEKEKLCNYLEIIPIPDIVVFVTASIETCQSRMMDRPDGLTERLKSADNNEILAFLTTAQNHLKFVAEWLHNNYHERIIEINSEKELAEIRPKVIEKIRGLSRRNLDQI